VKRMGNPLPRSNIFHLPNGQHLLGNVKPLGERLFIDV
jgi:hypothetical protein